MDNKNLFSIGEIAKAVGITRKTILNYELKGLIKPDKKDKNTGNYDKNIQITFYFTKKV